MLIHVRSLIALLLVTSFAATSRAEVFVRWDQEQIPPPETLGLSRLVIRAANKAAVQNALALGYTVYLEADGRLAAPAGRTLALEERGHWPHIRTNWVTRRDNVLQVSSRTSQPWIEQNAALIRIVRTAGAMPVLTYAWKPITLADMDEGPALENYLIAIAETGTFGADLVLPLHERFQKDLLLGKPAARAWWKEIRRHIEFYAGNLPNRYRPIANIGVVTSDPAAQFEILNLLSRHNLPFELITPNRLSARETAAFKLLIVTGQPDAAQLDLLSAFARIGGTVVLTSVKGAMPWYSAPALVKTEERASYRVGEGRIVEVLERIADPNTFALEMRQVLGPEHRVIDIWNGITVLAVPYEAPDGTMLVTALNYTAEALTVQVRVRGTYSLVHLESPEQEPVLLPYRHRDGGTEFVLPALRVGARVFLSQKVE